MAKYSRTHLGVVLSLVVFLATLIIGISWGASGFFLDGIGEQNSQQRLILFTIRVPRVLVAGICGASLALAGVVSQGLFRNPLAGPTILGTTGGANMLVVLFMFLGITQDHWFYPPIIAFLGAGFSTVVVIRLALSRVFLRGERLLLAGFALNSLFAAVTTFILSLSLNEYGLSQSIVYWLLGGCNGKGWHHVFMGLPWFSLGIFLSFFLAKQLNVLNLGEDLASSLSINLKRLRVLSILAMAILVAGAVALCGGIGFIGLIVPHFTRLYSGAENRRLMVLSLFNGASLLIAADTVARTVLLPQELQVGAIISLIGAPLFLILMAVRARNQES